MTWHRHTASPVACLATGILLSHASFAGNWTTEAGLAVGGIYSDNICLEQNSPEERWVGTTTPDIRVTGDGTRANMDLFASLEFNTLSNSSLDCVGGQLGFGDKESPAPRLRFEGDSILVEDWLFLDASAFIDQNKINAFGVGGANNINGTGNTNTSYFYRISPYIDRRLGDSSQFTLRYTYDEQYNSETLVEDSKGQLVTVDIGTDPELARFSIGVTGSYSKVEYDESFGQNTVNSELSSTQIRSAFQMNSQWQLNAYVGEEWNDFISTFEDTEGHFWDVGILWTPNARVSLAIGTGERFFGSTPRFDFEYRHKRSNMRASYARNLTYDRNLRGTDQFTTDVDSSFDDGQVLAGAPTTFTNSPLLDERFTLVYTYTGRRTTVNLSTSHSEQTRSADGFKDTFISMGLLLNRRLSRNLSFNSSLLWEDRQADEERDTVSARDSNTWLILLGLQQNLSLNTSLSLNYQYSDRNSESITDEYEESRLSLSLRYQF